ncbi:hypothetical protein E0Z10_g3105 [Xylaria hypoxylon]|uniref:Methyltransferase n=1 Tax=Xylaria hypoxylon TaxID=37992 RepID=A0A4Z0Z0D3_9PEZI|nr:hypothetical protein E0Z10_g3105 [Xylaria hypoxylon]
MSTEAEFNYFDTTSQPAGTVKPWTKVDAGGASFGHRRVSRTVHDLRKESPSEFNTDVSGFGLQHWPAGEKDFVDDEAVRGAYYDDVEAVLRANCDALASNAGAGKDGANNKVHKVVIFDHTIRRRVPGAPRGPVQQVHVDQTPAAVVVRLINVWRPISHAASDHPLAVIDWRTTAPEDFVPVDLLYPKRADSVMDDDDRGKEQRPSETNTKDSTEGYEARGETMAVRRAGGKRGLAMRTPHTAFVDPATPKDAKPRESIEVRALVFYEE